jgi:ribosomal protein S18 acetylase RimI-like enzyme
MKLMDNRYQIREAAEEDMKDMVRMRLSLKKHMSRRNPFLWELSRKRIDEQPGFYRKMMKNENIKLLVVYDSEANTNVGMGFGWKQNHDDFIPDRSGRIEDIWIEPEHRRKGLCTKLILQLIDFFNSDGINSLVLEYGSGNIEAEHVWAQLGFHDVLKTANADISDVKERCEKIES